MHLKDEEEEKSRKNYLNQECYKERIANLKDNEEKYCQFMEGYAVEKHTKRKNMSPHERARHNLAAKLRMRLHRQRKKAKAEEDKTENRPSVLPEDRMKDMREHWRLAKSRQRKKMSPEALQRERTKRKELYRIHKARKRLNNCPPTFDHFGNLACELDTTNSDYSA